MRVFLVNPSHVSFGIAVITPRWLYVLAAATPAQCGDPIICDETLDPFDPEQHRSRRRRRHRHSHRQRAARLRSRQGRARARRAGSSSAAFTPRCIRTKPHELGGAHAVVKGDGDLIWGRRSSQTAPPVTPQPMYEAGRVARRAPSRPARWDLLPEGPLHVGVGADRSRLPEALLVLLGLAHRRPGAAATAVDSVVDEIVELRRRGFRFIALADDNFYPVSLADLAHGGAAQRRHALAASSRRFAPSASS